MVSMFQPIGLSKTVSIALFQCLKRVEKEEVSDLLLSAKEHLQHAYEVNERSGMVNTTVAEAIVSVFQMAYEEWQTISQIARPWCKAMMAYFTAEYDDENDFNSPIGFDDDVEVVNACLKFAGREDLCIQLDAVSAELPKKTVKNPASRIQNVQAVKPQLTSGQRVLCRDAEWLVTRVDVTEHKQNSKTGKMELEHAVHCVGVDDLVRGHEAIFLTQLDEIIPVDPAKTKLIKDGSNGYKLSKLFLGAQLRQMPATGIHPDLKGLGVFKPMKFQEEVVARALRQLRPRLLLADAVGLGKTIQVGMVLTELMRRGRANRILVLAKKSMLTQFQAELWNRFNIPLVRLDSAGIAKLRLRIPANKNPFEVYHRVIVSIDTLKNVGRYEHFLKDTRWDVVVIDEAHNVAGASVPERNLSYRLARQLSRRADSVLLTTATPHNGKRETFGRLISLLDPSVIPDPQFKEYTADDIKNFYVMRFKEDVRADAGDLLTERRVIPLPQTTVDATSAEEEVYKILADLRRKTTEPDDDSLGKRGWQHHAMVQYVLYKLFLSSPEACIETVQKRLALLRDQDNESPLELEYLSNLEGHLHKLDITMSSRYQLLKKQLTELGWTGRSNSPRILIFTESPRTQKALAPALARDFSFKYSDKFEHQSSQVLATLRGSTPDIHLMKTVEAFATGSAPVRLLLATDVASEGINLHHECHHIIHYDLPWSIITLVQRNGRIDRLGQKHCPELRYLMVNTRQGVLQGDKEIFERLVGKVEEINRLRQSGESVLQLYDPQAEEEYIATQGVLASDINVLEKAGTAVSAAESFEEMLKMANQAGHDDFLNFLTGDDAGAEFSAPKTGQPDPEKETRIRLFSDKDFFTDGYELITGKKPEVHGNLLKITAEKDLKRRLGAPDSRGDVIFGATAIPSESWPDNSEFWLSDDPDRVNAAIEAARNTSGYWAKELLCSESHPILQWVTQRLVMQVRRGEAPFILSDKFAPGEQCFCFIGQVSSVSGTPLLIDAHAISFRQDGNISHHGLREILEKANFEKMINTGAEPDLLAAELLIHSAVTESIGHMRVLLARREKELHPLLIKEERRLRAWSSKRREILEAQIATLGEKSKQAKRFRLMLEEMEEYLNDRQQNWRDTHFTASREPSTQLLLVIGGKE
jgi:ERCC4-related helicase